MKISKINGKLQLQNKGNLELVFIGVGTAFTQNLHNNNLLIIKGNTHILVDFGMTGPAGLFKNTGLLATDIDVILPTHSHSDHIGGIEFLTLNNRYIAQKVMKKNKLKMIIPEEYEKILWNNSLKGGMQWNEINEGGKKLKFGDYYDLIHPKTVSNKTRTVANLNFGGIKLDLFRTNHIPDIAKNENQAFISYGMMIDDRVFFSGDTKFDRALVEGYEKKSEVLFHDCSFKPNPVHAGLDDLKTLSKEVKKKMLLMHYSDDFENYDIKGFKGLAKEGVRYIFD